MKLRLDIPEKVNLNCHVFKLGWTYPICILNQHQFNYAKVTLRSTLFGRSAQRRFFTSYGCSNTTPTFRCGGNFEFTNARYYADARLWKSRSYCPREDFWIVFKTEKDRTLAMMLLGQ